MMPLSAAMRRSRRFARAILTRIQTPLVWAPLTMLLLVDAAQLAEQDSNSTCGAAIWGCLDAMGCGNRSFVDGVRMPMAYAVRSGDRYRFIGRRDGTPQGSDVWLAGVYHGTDRRLSGFWALTRESTTEDLTVENCSWNGLPTLTSAEEAFIRAAYIAAHPELAHLAHGTVTARRILWPGVAHSTAAAAVGALWLASLPWMWTWWPRTRASTRLAAGLCPACAYDLRTGSLAACPECGWGKEGA